MNSTPTKDPSAVQQPKLDTTEHKATVTHVKNRQELHEATVYPQGPPTGRE